MPQTEPPHSHICLWWTEPAPHGDELVLRCVVTHSAWGGHRAHPNSSTLGCSLSSFSCSRWVREAVTVGEGSKEWERELIKEKNEKTAISSAPMTPPLLPLNTDGFPNLILGSWSKRERCALVSVLWKQWSVTSQEEESATVVCTMCLMGGGFWRTKTFGHPWQDWLHTHHTHASRHGLLLWTSKRFSDRLQKCGVVSGYDAKEVLILLLLTEHPHRDTPHGELTKGWGSSAICFC